MQKQTKRKRTGTKTAKTTVRSRRTKTAETAKKNGISKTVKSANPYAAKKPAGRKKREKQQGQTEKSKGSYYRFTDGYYSSGGMDRYKSYE